MTDSDEFLFHLDDPETEQVNLPNSTAVLILGILSITGAFYFGFPGVIIGLAGFLLAKKNGPLQVSSRFLYKFRLQQFKHRQDLFDHWPFPRVVFLPPDCAGLFFTRQGLLIVEG